MRYFRPVIYKVKIDNFLILVNQPISMENKRKDVYNTQFVFSVDTRVMGKSVMIRMKKTFVVVVFMKYK